MKLDLFLSPEVLLASQIIATVTNRVFIDPGLCLVAL